MNDKMLRNYPTVWPYYLAITVGRLVCWLTRYRRHRKYSLSHIHFHDGSPVDLFCGRCQQWIARVEISTGAL